MVHPKYIDIAERVLLTWFSVFLTTYAPAVLGADTLKGMVDMNLLDKASTAAVGAVFMLVANLLGLRVGNGEPPFFLAPNATSVDNEGGK